VLIRLQKLTCFECEEEVMMEVRNFSRVSKLPFDLIFDIIFLQMLLVK